MLLCGQQTETIEWNRRLIQYEVHHDHAVVEGDIVLGTVPELRTQSRLTAEHPDVTAIIPGQGNPLWPGATVYYTIDPAIPDPQRILDGIAFWTSATPLKILPRTSEANYVKFARDTDPRGSCESMIGMAGGEQEIQVLDSCAAGVIAHEIGHALGLQHEQARNDRNDYITVLWAAIDKSRYLNFVEAPFRNREFGYYDYDSIMHYGPKGFGVLAADTLETVPVGIPIGQRIRLSAGDIDGIQRLYGFQPASTIVTTIPAGLTVNVDGADVLAPHSFSWGAGETHTVSAAAQQGTGPLYRYVRWSDGGSGTHALTTLPDRTAYAAVYQELHQLVTNIASGDGSVAASANSSDGYFPQRQPIVVSATPSPGSSFLSWQPVSDLSTNGESRFLPSPFTEVLNQPTTFAANFTTAPLTVVDTQPSGRVLTADGGNYFTPANFVWQAGTTHTLSVAASQTDSSGSAHYAFVSWEDGTTGLTRTVTAGGGASAFVATVSPSYLLTTNAIGTGAVSVSPPSSDGYYAAGTVVQIMATPGIGTYFRYWLGDARGGNTAISLTLDHPRLATAFFNSIRGILSTSSATYLSNPLFDITGAAVAPNELVTIFGTGIGPAVPIQPQPDSTGQYPTSVDGLEVRFDNNPAPILFASSTQINVIVPAGVQPGGLTSIQVLRNSQPVSSLGVSVYDTAAGLFTADGSGLGQIAALNAGSSANSAANPAPRGSIVTLYATGAGAWQTPLPGGRVTGAALTYPVSPVQVRIGRYPATVTYAGSAPTLVEGVLQVNVQIPQELLPGDAIPVQLIVGQIASPPGTTLAIR